MATQIYCPERNDRGRISLFLQRGPTKKLFWKESEIPKCTLSVLPSLVERAPFKMPAAFAQAQIVERKKIACEDEKKVAFLVNCAIFLLLRNFVSLFLSLSLLHLLYFAQINFRLPNQGENEVTERTSEDERGIKRERERDQGESETDNWFSSLRERKCWVVVTRPR